MGCCCSINPLATGVLPLCFGAATKFSQIQLDADKTYEAVLLLGLKTTTGDAEGDVIETRPVPDITPELLEKLTVQFTGPIAQIPPMYSALKKDGKALYEYARKGEEVEREARNIIIYQLSMAVTQDLRAPAAIKIIVKCSKGTYIRTARCAPATAAMPGGQLSICHIGCRQCRTLSEWFAPPRHAWAVG